MEKVALKALIAALNNMTDIFFRKVSEIKIPYVSSIEGAEITRRQNKKKGGGGHDLKANTCFIERVQSLLDEGNTKTKVSNILGVHHSKVTRLVNKGLVEVYTAFDEDNQTKYLYQNFEWLWEEDRLEDITSKVIIEGSYVIPRPGCRSEDDFKVGKYCREVYGDLRTYLSVKGFDIISDCVYMECVKCSQVKDIEKFDIHRRRHLGLESRCKECMKTMKSNWAYENKEKMSAAAHRRRARLKNLPDDFYDDDIDRLMEVFNGGCALTDDYQIHLDHAIPLATGQGGTINGNMIPLRADLNFSKNDSNIFEWFEANRQRFELSQERFDNLIAWLASANAMTVEEYRDYVYWCHENPRSIDELEDAAI